MKVKSTKWYWRFWPPERRKVKIMQIILDNHWSEIDDKVKEAYRRHLITGRPVDYEIHKAFKLVDKEEENE